MRSYLHSISLACFGLIASATTWGVEVYVNVPPSTPKPGGRAQMREAPTKEEVLERKAKAPNPFAANTVTTVPAGEEVKPAPRPSLTGSVLMLNDGKQWTMLPGRSVLRFPDHIKQHIREGKAGELVSWERFQNANRAWILSIPMTDAHLSGKLPITEEQKKKWAEIRQLLVTTYAGNPVALPLSPTPSVALQSSASNSAKP